MQKKLAGILCTILVAGLAACGETDDRSAGGERPLARVEGTIQGLRDAAYTSPHVGLIWVNWGDYDAGIEPSFLEQVTAVDAGRMPVTFGLSVFQPPPATAYNALVDHDGNELARIALALVVAFDDVDRDGSFVIDETGVDAPDLLFGASWYDFLFHIPAPLPEEIAAGLFANPEAATPGFHVVRFDDCNAPVIVDNGTFTIEAFPASSAFPEPPGSRECEPEGPTDGPCADPESEACAACIDRALAECLTDTCGDELGLLVSCAEESGCDLEEPEGTCVEENCPGEIAAVEACMYTCDGMDACLGWTEDE